MADARRSEPVGIYFTASKTATVNADDRSLVSLVGIAHALVHTYELSFPILIGAWLVEFDTTRAVLGVVLTIGYGLFGIGALPTGVVVDGVGSRRVLEVCLAGMGLSFVALAFVGGPWTIAIVLLVWGLAASMYHPAGLTLISTAAKDRGAVLAYHGMAGNLGIAVGPLVTALLLVVLDWRLVVVLLAIPALAGAGYARWTRLRSVGPRPDDGTQAIGASVLAESRSLLASTFLGVLVVVVFSGLYYRSVLTFLPDVFDTFEGFGPLSIGGYTLEPGDYVFVAILMVGVVGQYAGGRLSNRADAERILMVCFLALAVIAVAFVPVVSGPVGLVLLCGLCLGVVLFMVQPLYQAAVADHTPQGARGLSYGFTYLGVFGIGAIGSTLAGGVLTYASVDALFVVLAGIALLAAAAARRIDR